MQGTAAPIRTLRAALAAAAARAPRASRVALVAVLAAAGLFASVAPASAASVVFHGSRSQRVVALTFDDAWSAPIVRRILSILSREHVHATFFPVSAAVRSSPSVWRRALREGNAIGDHTINHLSLTALSSAAMRRQLVDSQRMIKAATGQAISPYVRPPYGLWDGDVVRAASAAGFRAVVMWDVDARDWEGWSPGRLVHNATRGTNGSIVVMHALPSTVRVLPRIIRSYRHRGFRFVTVPQLLGFAPTSPGGGPVPARAASAPVTCPDPWALGPLAPLSDLLGAASITAQLYRSWIARALLASASLSSLGTAYLALARVPVALPLGPPGCAAPTPDSTARTQPSPSSQPLTAVRRLN